MDNDLTLVCPNCYGTVIVNKLDTNCCIFRHGIWKSNNTQVDPHATEAVCMNAVKNDLIFGCGRPFRLDLKTMTTMVCDYL
jgi:hypothetical protein